MIWAVVIASVSAGAAVASVLCSAVMARAVLRQIRQAHAFNMTSLRIQHNWSLFDRRRDIPPVLPEWFGLTDEGWAWRVLHLNHLNLLRYAYDERMHGVLSASDLEARVSEAKSWFRRLAVDPADGEIALGRDTLRTILGPGGGEDTKFRQWLVDCYIVPRELTEPAPAPATECRLPAEVDGCRNDAHRRVAAAADLGLTAE